MVKRAVEMEGTVTGEHGVGLVKRDYLEHELGQSTVDLMRKVGRKFSLIVMRLLMIWIAEASLRSAMPSELRQSSSIKGTESGRNTAMVMN